MDRHEKSLRIWKMEANNFNMPKKFIVASYTFVWKSYVLDIASRPSESAACAVSGRVPEDEI